MTHQAAALGTKVAQMVVMVKVVVMLVVMLVAEKRDTVLCDSRYSSIGGNGLVGLCWGVVGLGLVWFGWFVGLGESRVVRLPMQLGVRCQHVASTLQVPKLLWKGVRLCAWVRLVCL